MVGAEKMFYPDQKDLMFKAFMGGWDVHDMDNSKKVLLSLGEGLPLPPEAQADTGQHSVFMDIYASLARQHMRIHGTTPRQIAAAASKSHYHATMNPLAQYRFDMSVDAILERQAGGLAADAGDVRAHQRWRRRACRLLGRCVDALRP